MKNSITKGLRLMTYGLLAVSRLSLVVSLIIGILSFGFFAFASYKAGFVRRVPPYMPGEAIVKFKNVASITSTSVENLNKRFDVSGIKKIFKGHMGPSILSPFDFSAVYKLSFSKEQDVKQVINEYKKDPSVYYAEPNYVMEICTPNDPYYKEYPDDPNQWGLFKIGLTSLESGVSGWNIENGTPEVVIAVVDTGVAWNHADLGPVFGNIWINYADPWIYWDGEPTTEGDRIDNDYNGYIDDGKGWNFVSVSPDNLYPGERGGPDNNPIDGHGHGTHVAGIISASTNNSIGIAGTAWRCRIMPLRAGFKGVDGGGYLTDEDAAEAIIYAADNGAHVINMSWGSTSYANIVSEAIGYAYGKGSLLVGAAGNSNTDIEFYPAASDRVIAVGATDRLDRRSVWNFFNGSNYGSWIGVSAPGGGGGIEGKEWIYSLALGNQYKYEAGTSMAAPFVSGLAGLLKAHFPGWTNKTTVNQIKYTTDHIPSSGQMGTGRINAYKALTYPQAGIKSPKSRDLIYGGLIIEITGIATDAVDADMTNWVLDYSYYKNPEGWTIITSRESSSPSLEVDGKLADWTVPNDELGFHTLRLRVTDALGHTNEAKVTVSVVLEGELRLLESLAGPSPFNPNSGPLRIKFKLSTITYDLNLRIYDILGNLIHQQRFAFLDAGDQIIDWNGKNNFGEIVPNGVYLYHIIIDGELRGKGKFIVLK